MQSTCFLPLNVVDIGGDYYSVSIGGRNTGELDYVALFIYKNGKGVNIAPKVPKKGDNPTWSMIFRPPSQTLLDLLANWQHHKFDPPIYDCLLEEYPEIGEYL